MELHAPKSNGTAIIGLVMSEIVQMLHHCMVNKTIAAQIKNNFVGRWYFVEIFFDGEIVGKYSNIIDFHDRGAWFVISQ